MTVGNTPPEGIGRRIKKDPVPAEVLRIAEEIKVRSTLVLDKGNIRDSLDANDTRRERIKFEIRDELVHFQRELRNLRDYKDQLSEKALKTLDQVDIDIIEIINYLDDAWPTAPFAAFADDIDTLYTELI